MFFITCIILHARSLELGDRCEVEHDDRCLSCKSDYFNVEGICLDSCPSSYISDRNQCIPMDEKIFSVDFSIGPTGNVEEGRKLGNVIFTADRGGYFDGASIVSLNLTSRPGPKWSVSMWIRLLDSGSIIELTEFYSLRFDQSIITFHVSSSENLIELQTPYASNEWIQLTIYLVQDLRNLILSTITKTSSDQKAFAASANYNHNGSNWILGSFHGFIYKVISYNKLYIIEDEAPLGQCNPFEYSIESICRDIQILNVPWWCMSNGEDVCEKFLKKSNPTHSASHRFLSSCMGACDICTGPSLGQCTQCSSDFYSVDGVCISICPTGFLLFGSQCIPMDSFIFKLDLDGVLSNHIYDSQQQLLVVTGINNQFYPDYDITDPYATKERGFYFTGTSLLNIPMNSIKFSPLFTIAAWVNAKASSGTIFSKQSIADSKIITFGIDPNFYATSSINSEYSTSVNAISQDSWGFLSVQYSLTSDLYYTSTFFLNKLTSSVVSATQGWLDDNVSLFTIIIGGEYPLYTNFFKGFVWKFYIYNSNLIDIVALGMTFTAPPDCDITQYVQEGICLPCASGCTQGCVRPDSSCNLCADPLCNTCNSFGSGCSVCKNQADGEPCECTEGYYYDTNNEGCYNCQNNCQECDGIFLGQCNSCSYGYFNVQGVCISICPTGFISDYCIQEREFVFDLDLNRMLTGTMLDLQSQLVVSAGIYSSFYPEYSESDPYATLERGYYFTGQSLLNVQMNSIAFAPIFTICAWVNPEILTGTILAKQDTDESLILSFEINSGLVVLTTRNFSLKSKTVINASKWNFLSVQVSLTATLLVSPVFQINDKTDILPLSSSGWLDDSTPSFTILIGGQYPLYTNFFTGFLWKLEIYNSDTVNLNDLYLPDAMPPTCKITEYYDMECKDCNDNCTQGCVRNNISCNLCPDEMCLICENFSEYCQSCIENASGSPCECLSGYYLNQVSEKCEACTDNCNSCTGVNLENCSSCIQGYNLIAGVCISVCPTGYIYSQSVCTDQKTSSILVDFNNVLSDKIVDQEENFVLQAGLQNTFYPEYDISDPWATKDRGFYFNGMALVNFPLNRFVFSPVFTIYAWINSYNKTGTILAKQTLDDKTLVGFGIDENTIYCTILSAKLQGANSLPRFSWNLIVVEASLTSSLFYSAQLYINLQSESVASIVPGWLDDNTKDFTMIIGGEYPLFTNFFKGFLWKFSIQNRISTDLELVYYTEHLPPTCLITEFYDGICQKCQDKCEFGCVSSSTCNLCMDKNCYSCSTFDGACNECQVGYALTDEKCIEVIGDINASDYGSKVMLIYTGIVLCLFVVSTVICGILDQIDSVAEGIAQKYAIEIMYDRTNEFQKLNTSSENFEKRKEDSASVTRRETPPLTPGLTPGIEFLNPEMRIEIPVLEKSISISTELGGMTQIKADKINRSPLFYHNFVSFILYSDPWISRSTRSLVLFTSLFTQSLLIGIYSYQYEDDISFSHGALIDIIICLFAPLISNAILFPANIFFFENKANVEDHDFESKKRNTKRIIGSALLVVIIIGMVIAICVQAVYTRRSTNLVWFELVIIGVSIDFFVIQFIKAVILISRKAPEQTN